MEVTVDSAVLSAVLKQTHSIATKFPSMPILGSVLLTTTGSGITATAFDMEVGIVCEVAAQVKKPGSVLLSKEAFSFVESLRGPVTIARDTKGNGRKCTISAKHTSAFFYETGGVEDFPKLPEATCVTSEMVVPAMLAMLRRVPHAASRDGQRPAMQGAHLYVPAPGMHCMVASDGKRIAQLTRAVGGFSLPPGGVVLPLAALSKMKEILESAEPEGWEFGVTSTIAALRRPGFLFLTKLVDASFPDHTKVTSMVDTITTISVPRLGLLEGLKRVSLVSSEVGMVLEESGTLRFEASSEKRGDGADAMPVRKQRMTPRRAWFSYKHISEALVGAEGDEVLISVPPADNTKGVPAFILTPKEDGYLACVMPLSNR